MHVALLNFCFEDYTIELANALINYVDLTLIQPHKVADICGKMLDSRIRLCSFKKPRIRNINNIHSMIEMMQIIQSIGADILHVQETNDFWYDMTLLFNKMPPLVTTIHDVFRHPGDRETAPASEYTRLVSFYRSQHIIVHTRSLQDVLMKRFHIPQQRVSVVSHGELGSLYQRRGHSPHPLPREPHTLLFFGRVWPYKGLSYLLEAMPLIAQHIPDVKLIIAGRGESLQRYFPNGYDRCRYEIFNDFIPAEDVIGLFQRSALTVLPYVESSQSGVAALSYGLGTPVVASNVGGLSEMIQNGKDGFLVPPRDAHSLANAIVCILRDRDLQHQMQKAALSRCQSDLNWSTIAYQTVDIYHQLITSETVD